MSRYLIISLVLSFSLFAMERELTPLYNKLPTSMMASVVGKKAFDRIKYRELDSCTCKRCENDEFEKQVISCLLAANQIGVREIVDQLKSRANDFRPEFVKYCYYTLPFERWDNERFYGEDNPFEEILVEEWLEITRLLNHHKIDFSIKRFFPTKSLAQQALFKATGEELAILLQGGISWKVLDKKKNTILHSIAEFCKENETPDIFSRGICNILSDAQKRLRVLKGKIEEEILQEKIPSTTFGTMLTKKNNDQKTPHDIMQEVINVATESEWSNVEQIKEFAKEFRPIEENNENS